MDQARWSRSLATKVSRPYSLGLWFVGMDEKRSIQRKGKYKRRIAGSHYGGAALIKECQDDLRRTTRTITTRGAKCIEVG
jgi:hypothetical protein